MKRLSGLALVVVAAVATGAVLTRLDGDEAAAALPRLVDLAPAEVQRLVVETGAHRAEFTRHARGWSAGNGTAPPSASLLLTAEDDLFPLLAYRAVDADPEDGQYGLRDPAAVMRVEDRRGRWHAVRMGGPSFSGAGFFAGPDGERRRIYLVPRNTLDLLRTLATGERVASPDPLQARAERHRAEAELSGRSQESPYLRQVLEAGGRPPAAP